MENEIPGLWKFTSALKGVHHRCNGYLLKQGENWVLIDPPEDLTRQAVEEAVPGACVTGIFITHVQEEHVAGARHFPEASVHVPAGDEYLCQGVPFYEREIAPWLEPWDWETRGNYRGHLGGAKNERPAREPLKLGASLRVGERILDFDIVATPGHGKHAVTLLAEIGGQKAAFCGDLIFGEGKLWNWFDCDWDYGLEAGQRTLALSCRRLRDLGPDLACPAHGGILRKPEIALACLEERIARVISQPEEPPPQPVNFPETAEPVEGWRKLAPHLFQWKAGNTLILTSSTGNALVIDDGLCIWEPLEERVARHDAIFERAKSALGIRKIEWIISTHFHGDHTEMIPRLAQREGARVICLESVAGPMEHPERYNLACSLPWYGTVSQRVGVDLRVPENYRLDWHEYQLRLFHLGGQTGYHLGVEAVIDGLRVLFAGDAFWGTSTSPQPVLCWNDAEPVGKGWVFALHRMIERRPDLLVCGHGSALRDPLPYLQAVLGRWEKRLEDYAGLNGRSSREEFFSPFLAIG